LGAKIFCTQSPYLLVIQYNRVNFASLIVQTLNVGVLTHTERSIKEFDKFYCLTCTFAYYKFHLFQLQFATSLKFVFVKVQISSCKFVLWQQRWLTVEKKLQICKENVVLISLLGQTFLAVNKQQNV